MKLSFDRRGSGEPLVLIHGIGHRWQAWEPVIERLAAHHDVIAIDIPGFGESAPLELGPGERHTIDVATRHIAAAFQDFGIERPHVAGNSLGGALALELAKAGHAASATALSPAGFWAKRWEVSWALGNLTLTRWSAFAPKPMLRFVANSPTARAVAFGMIFGKPRKLDPELAFGDTISLRNGKGFRPIAKEAPGYRYSGESDVPTTIAWGTKDKILLRRQFARAHTLVPKARFVDLPECGHVPMNDDPELVARVILETTGALSSAREGGGR
jgi:pimeloyl-ACP methyl ester carboxylesterase